MSTDSSVAITHRPYPVTLTASIDGNNTPYFLYFAPNGEAINSPLVIPDADPPYDGIRFTQTGDNKTLKLWAAVTHTLEVGLPPQGDNLLFAVGGSVSITVKCGTQRGTVLVFEQLDASGAVINLVPTPDPRTQNNG